MMHPSIFVAIIFAFLSAVARADVVFSAPSFSQGDSNGFRIYANLQSTEANQGFWWIDYGTSASYGSTSSPQSLAAGSTVTDSYLFISGLQPSTEYHYRYHARVGVTHYLGTTDYTITTASASVVVRTPIPSNKLLVAGADFTLNVDVTGNRNLTSLWKHNGIDDLSTSYTGTGVSLHLPSIASTDAGAWQCHISNSVPSSTDTGVINVVVASVTKFPATAVAKEGGTITATVTLSPASAVATYNWKLSTGPLTSAVGNYSGNHGNKLTITNVTAAADATYQCEVTVGSETVTVSAGRAIIGLKPGISVPSSPVTLTVGQAASIGINITPNDSGAVTTTVTGLPVGLGFSSGTGVITGQTFAPTPLDVPIAITVKSTNVNGTSTLVFPLTVVPLDASMAGSYDGVISASADPTGIGGRITLKVTTLGVVTGSLTLGTVVYPINAKLISTNATYAKLSIPALKSGTKPTVNVDLVLSSGGVSGQINSVSTTCTRSTWSALNPVPVPGLFNCYFTPGSTELASSSYPHGHSIGSFNVSSTGVVAYSGRMADGTAVTAASALSDSGGLVPIFAALYAGKGAVSGVPSIDGNARNVSGQLSWLKLASAGGRAYASGFASHALTCTGKRYVKPNAALGQLFLGLTLGASNAHLNFTDSTLSSPVSQAFTVNASSGVVLPAGAADASALTLTLNLATGQINGTFKVTDPNPVATGNVTRTGTYYGIATQGYVTPVGQAFGFFTLPNLPAVGATNLTTNPVTSGIAIMGQ